MSTTTDNTTDTLTDHRIDMAAMAAVFAAVGEHLDVFTDLPAPVLVTSYHPAVTGACPVTFQLTSGHHPAVLAAQLLAWADTLNWVSCEAWRHEDEDAHTMHLYVRGGLTDGTPVQVFASTQYAPSLGLDLGQRDRVDLAQLYAWAAARTEVTP
ncbi:hypothetical protein [Actinokineospora sp. HUAS TT18]|uniref:hypothetical protein n=1 Tax=Actinokineospora sp. HUAS TT18 TaxID=3447451 RepID=UPI003F51E4B6